MKGVKNTVLGMKLDKDGNFVGMKFMKPNKEYDFEDAASVLEIPKYAPGGIAGKFDISSLVLPINGTDPEEGTMYKYDENNNPVSYPKSGPVTKEQQQIHEEIMSKYQNNPLFLDQNQGGTGNQVLDEESAKQKGYSQDDVNMMEEEDYLSVDSLDDEEMAPWMEKGKEELQAIDNEMNNLYEEEVGPSSINDELDVNQQETQKFFNPYGGVDIPTAASVLGQGIENKNPWEYIPAGLKLVTGLGRNVLGGIGQARMSNWQEQERLKKTNQPRETYVGKDGGQYFKKGGVSKEKLLTGEYITGVDTDTQAQMANAEVEAGEYIKTNDGDIAEVLGNKHSNSNGGEFIPLDEGEKVLSDSNKIGAKTAKEIRDNFDLDVKAKDTFSTILDKFRAKSGLKNIVKDEEKIQKQIDKVSNMEDSQTKGLNMQYLNSRLKEIQQQKEPLEEARKMIFDKVFEIQELSKPEAERAPEFRTGGKRMYKDGGEGMNPKYQRERLEQWYRNLRGAGFEGEIDLEAEDFGPEAGKLQEFMVKNYPKEVLKYFKSGQPITSKGIQEIIDKNPEIFEKAGMDIPSDPSSLIPEERMKLQQALDEAGLFTDEFILNQFQDNRFRHRTPLVTSGLQSIESVGNTYDDNGFLNETTDLLSTEQYPTLSEYEPSGDITTGEDKKKKGKASNLLLLPDQYPMMPRGQQPHLKVDRRYDRQEAFEIDPRQYISAIDAQIQAGFEQIDSAGLSPQVAEAAKARLRSEGMDKTNQVLSQIDAKNIMSKQGTEQANTEIQRMEENAAAMDDLSYEQRTLTAKAKTDYEMDDYFDKIQQVNIGNYATIEALNRSNEMFSNVQATGTSSFDVDTPEFKNMLNMYMAMQAAQQREEKEKDKK